MRPKNGLFYLLGRNHSMPLCGFTYKLGRGKCFAIIPIIELEPIGDVAEIPAQDEKKGQIYCCDECNSPQIHQ